MSDRKRILIIGGNGFVGSSLARQWTGTHQVICTYRQEFTRIPGVDHLQFNGLSDKDRCTALVAKVEPWAVIYAAGSNDPMKAEKESALTQLTHMTGPSHMLIASEYVKAKFIYLSSDWIFSGGDGNYLESDTGIPVLALGKTKLGSENYIRSRSLNHVIIRCSPLLGRGPLDHPSWLDEIRTWDLGGTPRPLASHLLQNPVHVTELGTMIDRVLDLDVRNKTLHLGGLTKITPRDLALKFLNRFDYEMTDLPVSKTGAEAGAQDFSLNFSQTLKLLKTQPLLLEQSLDLLE